MRQRTAKTASTLSRRSNCIEEFECSFSSDVVSILPEASIKALRMIMEEKIIANQFPLVICESSRRYSFQHQFLLSDLSTERYKSTPLNEKNSPSDFLKVAFHIAVSLFEN